jgi:hypothetical protein
MSITKPSVAPRPAPTPVVIFLCDSQSLDAAVTADIDEGQMVGDAVGEMVVLIMLVEMFVDSMAEPAGMCTVPLPVEQQLRAAWSWPQQKVV